MTSIPTVFRSRRGAKDNVDGGAIRDLRGALRVDEHGVVITTRHFTKDAVTEATASGKRPISLVDGPGLVDLLLERGIGIQTRFVPIRSLDTAALLGMSAGRAVDDSTRYGRLFMVD